MIWPVRPPSPPPPPTKPDCCRGVVYRRFALFPTIIGKRMDTVFPNLRWVWLRWYWKRGFYSRGRKISGEFFVVATGATREEVLPRRTSYFREETIAGRLFWIFSETHPSLPDCDTQEQYLDMTGIKATRPKYPGREWPGCVGQPKPIGEGKQ